MIKKQKNYQNHVLMDISQRSIVPKRATDTLFQWVSQFTHVCVIHVYTKLWYQKGATNYLSLISVFIDVFLWFVEV